MAEKTIEEKIQALKKKRNAVILAHNYQRPRSRTSRTSSGDSLELSQTAAQTKADVIVFCGVHFMAEPHRFQSEAQSALARRQRRLPHGQHDYSGTAPAEKNGNARRDRRHLYQFHRRG